MSALVAFPDPEADDRDGLRATAEVLAALVTVLREDQLKCISDAATEALEAAIHAIQEAAVGLFTAARVVS